MIKKVKILDIHERDAFYDKKKLIIGKTLTLDIENQEYIPDWSASHFVNLPYRTPKKFFKHRFDGVEFLAIKVEEVE